jgi:hypothetical protein
MSRTDYDLLLRQRILEKEQTAMLQGQLLKAELRSMHEQFRPVNMLKKAWKDVVNSPEIKTNAVDSLIGFSAGFLVKKLVNLTGKGPLRNIAGTVLEWIVALKATKNADQIKSAGASLLENVLSKKESRF